MHDIDIIKHWVKLASYVVNVPAIAPVNTAMEGTRRAKMTQVAKATAPIPKLVDLPPAPGAVKLKSSTKGNLKGSGKPPVVAPPTVSHGGNKNPSKDPSSVGLG